MKPEISIIVPIYNVEGYLERCLNSLLEQTFHNIEIIAVNDGSTDSSLSILRKYAQKDWRIKVIDQPNAGVSAARNVGIKVADGNFIGFVDPDDWVDKEMYESMITNARDSTADVVMCSYVREFGTHSKEKDFNVPEKLVYVNDDVKSKIVRRLIGPINEEVRNPELLDAWGTVWSKLYRTDLLKDNEIKFTDLSIIGTNEDSLFNIQAIFYARRFLFLNKPFYHYWRSNNSSVTAGYKPNLMEQWFNLYEIIEGFLKENKLPEQFFIALNNRKCMNIMGLGLNTLSESNPSSLSDKVKKLKTVINDERIKRSFQQLELASFPVVWRAFYFCAKIRSAIGLFIMLYSLDGIRKIIR